MSFVHMIYLLLSVWLCRPILAQTNIFISDQSPLVSFHPEWVDSGITNKTTKEASWNITYSEVSWSGVDITSGPVGQGCSTHWTEATDASISMQFSGISLYAWGNITARGGEGNASLAYGNTTLNIDGKNVSSYDPVNGTLGMISGVSAGWHNATIYYEGSGRLYFTGFTLTLNIQDDFNTTYLATNGSSTHPINPAFNLSGSDGDDWSLQSIATRAWPHIRCCS
ncbi:hypothetical protein BD324DRAFT_382192 [Kockovaella imperatae]|uniref:Concanavalin A-like lectin/glucanase domain-containing protein n=1 Tax=Kockovaella imperatae TaxID=4999 RepID=A0A1Y1UHJ9_9TREE|nr:hypothetical protein BD324DRAFT_382192 [Kockovaella imperatae]ORX37531.1 hypothetical protein BD324DRAFT_382192 [Kockovaella imperatae]